MKLAIHSAHGELIAERKQQMQLMQANFQVIAIEDKRGTDALLKAAGFDPAKYAEYKLVREGDSYFLDCTEAPPKEPQPVATVVPVPTEEREPKHVNGAA